MGAVFSDNRGKRHRWDEVEFEFLPMRLDAARGKFLESQQWPLLFL